jgi:hypothetical protein
MGAASVIGKVRHLKMAGPVRGGLLVAGTFAETHAKISTLLPELFLSKGCARCLSKKEIIQRI